MIALPPCFACIHVHDDGTCDAFPDGIPESIIRRGESHNDPRGDEVDGIVFELNPEHVEFHRIREGFISGVED